MLKQIERKREIKIDEIERRRKCDRMREREKYKDATIFSFHGASTVRLHYKPEI